MRKDKAGWISLYSDDAMSQWTIAKGCFETDADTKTIWLHPGTDALFRLDGNCYELVGEVYCRRGDPNRCEFAGLVADRLLLRDADDSPLWWIQYNAPLIPPRAELDCAIYPPQPPLERWHRLDTAAGVRPRFWMSFYLKVTDDRTMMLIDHAIVTDEPQAVHRTSGVRLSTTAEGIIGLRQLKVRTVDPQADQPQ